MSDPARRVTVQHLGRDHQLRDGESIVFGRDTKADVVGLRQGDTTISRTAVRIRNNGGLAWVDNLSSRPITLVRGVVAASMPVKDSQPLAQHGEVRLGAPSPVTLMILVPEAPEDHTSQVPVVDGAPTIIPTPPTPEQREALAATYVRYILDLVDPSRLAGPPTPLSEDQTNSMLGRSQDDDQARKAVENTRRRLALGGWLYTSGPNARAQLGPWLIANQWITPADVRPDWVIPPQ